MILSTLATALVAGSPVGDALVTRDPQIHTIHLGKDWQLPNLVGAPNGLELAMPVFNESPFFEVDVDGAKLDLAHNNVSDPGFGARCRIEPEFPFEVRTGYLPIPQPSGPGRLSWSLAYQVRSWSSILDDHAAAEIAWPRNWPADVQPALQPEPLIESDAPIFGKVVVDVVGEEPRLKAPYFVARELLAYCIDEFTVNTTTGTYYEGSALIGLVTRGALPAAESGIGNPHDLTCLCIATLRAAGIPARVVVGMHAVEGWEAVATGGIRNDEWSRETIEQLVNGEIDTVPLRPDDGPGEIIGYDEYGCPLRGQPPRATGYDLVERVEFVTWGEFFLPQIGWIPFDPMVMRSFGRERVNATWPGLGTVAALNRRVPLAHHLTAPGTVQQREKEYYWSRGCYTPWAWGWTPEDHAREIPWMHLVDVEIESD